MRILHVSPGTAPASSPAVPALAHLAHDLAYATARLDSLARAGDADVVVLDASGDLAAAARIADSLEQVGRAEPVVVILAEGGLVAANPDWRIADFALTTAGPAEIDARLRLATARGNGQERRAGDSVIEAGPLRIDEDAYAAFVRDRQLDLTFKEFELLRHLSANAGRALTRAELLHDVWGYDFFGGTRTVDVHVRRLRAKLGPELDQIIHTVRNVGYRFSPEVAERAGGREQAAGGRSAKPPAGTGSADAEPAGADTADAEAADTGTAGTARTEGGGR